MSNSTLEVGVDGRLVCAAEEAQLAGIRLGRNPSTSIQEVPNHWSQRAKSANLSLPGHPA